MVIISKGVFSSDGAEEFGKRYEKINQQQVPSYLTRRGPYITSYINEGALILFVYELDNSKLAEGYSFAAKTMQTFFGVPGFKHETKVYAEMKDLVQ